MMMGEYEHSIDQKGRVMFPVKLREELGDTFYITRGLDGCLFVYSEPEWKKLSARIEDMPKAKSRDMQRFLFAGALPVEADKQGRTVIPYKLRQYANLDKDIVIVGVNDKAEIWDAKLWKQKFDSLSYDDIASVMDELGL